MADSLSPNPESTATDVRSLAGTWAFELDPDDQGRDAEWFGRELSETVELPGTTDENRKGDRTEARNLNRLTRTFQYEGAAWYQRHITVSEGWADRHVELFLERTRNTEVWVDETHVGGGEGLSTPQVFDVSESLTPGEHRLTVRVDNSPDQMGAPGVMNSHMATEHTQTNWNGILGRVELRVGPLVGIERARVHSTGPDSARAVVDLRNASGSPVEGHLDLWVESGDAGSRDGPDGQVPVSLDSDATTVETTVDLAGVERWDEFGPTSPDLTVRLANDGAGVVDEYTTPIPHCEFGVGGTQFQVNGATTFLRGTVDCCVFPETGYAPTTVEEWRDHLGTVREYGLNHVRFHSWCPPEAAFRAADELGIYLQPELPLWNGENALEADGAYEFYAREAERILDAYGNHPSFVMFALGNELGGDPDRLASLVDHCREHDPRHLYAQGSFNFIGCRGHAENEDYWTTAFVPGDEPPVDYGDEDNMPVRGSFGSYERGHVLLEPPSTETDYADVIEGVELPVVSHEIGQYQVYPDYDERAKYDGVLDPTNLDVAATHLEAHGMQDKDAAFQRDSGRLAVDCYREEVETALRTPGFGGFQLLALQDFPGQGTALVGVLDSFMDSKGLIEPEEWREFCSPVVPLARMESRTFRSDDSFEADLQIAQYGEDDIEDARVRWELSDDTTTVASDTLRPTDLPQGTLVDAGTITVSLDAVAAPARLTLDVFVEEAQSGDAPADGDGVTGSVATNGYDIWVYPPVSPSLSDESPFVSTAFDEETWDALESGRDVLLLLGDANQSVPAGYAPAFWSEWFKGNAPPRTLGASCDPSHPLFDRFPTDSFAGQQWYELLRESRPVRLEETPSEYEPIVSVIDNLHRNERLGLVFEAGVGDGNLLVCAAPLHERMDRPAVAGFLHSAVEYVRSDAFDPNGELSRAVIEEILAGPGQS